MKQKSALSGISSGKSSEALTEGFTIYDVPGALLDARGEAYILFTHPDSEVNAAADRIITLLSRAIRAMGREDVGVLQVVENKEEVA